MTRRVTRNSILRTRVLAALIAVILWALPIAIPRLKEAAGPEFAALGVRMAQDLLRRIRLRLLR